MVLGMGILYACHTTYVVPKFPQSSLLGGEKSNSIFYFIFFGLFAKIDTINIETEAWIPRHMCNAKVTTLLNHECVGKKSKINNKFDNIAFRVLRKNG